MTTKKGPILTADFVVRKDTIPQQVKPPVEAAPPLRSVTSLRLRTEDTQYLRDLGYRLNVTKTDLIDEAIGLLRERYKGR